LRFIGLSVRKIVQLLD